MKISTTFFRNTAFLILAAVAFFACQKELTGDLPGTDPTPDPTDSTIKIDLITKVTAASVTGFITDETNAIVTGATVKVGETTVTTDKYGYFEVRNVAVVKEAATVTATKAGYFKGIKTFIAAAGKSAFFRIKLLPKTNAGSFNAAAGGTITAAGGLKIIFPANAIVTEAGGAAYTGNVKVAAKWLDPTAPDLNTTMPGDLRGLDSNNSGKKLTTYGMAAVELTGDAGQLLQIAPGKKATLSAPIPASITASAPATIPLWYFNETNGLWKQEGSAIKNGNEYTGEVSHFSFWNYDVPANYVQLTCTVKTTAGNPVAFTRVKISAVNNPQNAAFGYTDSSGYVKGAVPDNSQLKLEVFGDNSCTTVIHSQTFSTNATDLSLVVTVNPPAANVANVAGIVTDCSNAPVTNGFVMVVVNGNNYRYNLSNTGGFSFIHLLCNVSDTAKFIGIDLSNPQQTVTVNHIIVSGNNQVTGIKVCGQTQNTEQFITYTLNSNGPFSFSSSNVRDSLYHTSDTSGTIVGAFRRDSLNTQTTNFVRITFSTAGIALGSNQNLKNLYGDGIFVPSSIPTPIKVVITEYGAVGEYISGNFSGQIIAQLGVPVSMNAVGSFRVKRKF